jgi:ElaB/YqjD/DUF883 family membrane-anchored ribosome-binding protein
MASATLNDAIDKTHDIASNSAAEAKARVNEMRSELATFKDEILSAVNDAYRASRKSAKKAAHEVGDWYDSAKDYTVNGVKHASQTAKSHPVGTLAVAVGLGVLVGALLLRRD